jgi:hypothetical protein
MLAGGEHVLENSCAESLSAQLRLKPDMVLHWQTCPPNVQPWPKAVFPVTRRTCFWGTRLSQLQCLQSITSISSLISHLSYFTFYPLLFSQQHCIFSFKEQMASSWFSYDLSRPYPYRWFTPVSLCGGALFLALFTWLNFAANGFELRWVIVSIN